MNQTKTELYFFVYYDSVEILIPQYCIIDIRIDHLRSYNVCISTVSHAGDQVFSAFPRGNLYELIEKDIGILIGRERKGYHRTCE
jgi:hypothetical protein